MKRLLSIICSLALLLVLIPGRALAVEDSFYTLYAADGSTLCRIGETVFVGDEYISRDNQLYRVVSVDEQTRSAHTEHLGAEPQAGTQAFASLAETMADKSADGNTKKLVGIYCTHSDESYENGDGTISIEQGGGIYDVANALAEELNTLGVETIVDETNHSPHDAGAYRRSRPTAAELAKKGPAALFDIHRDGIPDPGEYINEVDGETITMVRLLVGRQNANSAANREFAKLIKNTADEMYPGFIRDIFIGKGNYNQEIMPHSVLLEFGTHTSDKEMVLKSAPMMANVINAAVFGETATQQESAKPGATAGQNAATPPSAATGDPQGTQQGVRPADRSNKGAGSGIAWVIGLFIVGLIVVGLIAGGKTGLGGRLSRTMSEMTGGLVGRKSKDDDKLS